MLHQVVGSVNLHRGQPRTIELSNAAIFSNDSYEVALQFEGDDVVYKHVPTLLRLNSGAEILRVLSGAGFVINPPKSGKAKWVAFGN